MTNVALAHMPDHIEHADPDRVPGKLIKREGKCETWRFTVRESGYTYLVEVAVDWADGEPRKREPTLCREPGAPVPEWANVKGGNAAAQRA